MTFGELLREHKDAIVRRWFENALAAYAEQAAHAFTRQKDPFANPVGHALREGTREIFDALLGEGDDERIREHLGAVMRIRAIQAFSSSQSIAFIFSLKEIVRAQVGTAVNKAGMAVELAAFDAKVDQTALAAFDVYVACREHLADVRVNETKRRVSWIVEKLNARDGDAASVSLDEDQG